MIKELIVVSVTWAHANLCFPCEQIWAIHPGLTGDRGTVTGSAVGEHPETIGKDGPGGTTMKTDHRQVTGVLQRCTDTFSCVCVDPPLSL